MEEKRCLHDVCERMVLVPEDDLQYMKYDQKLLRALRAAGVDNWDGYDYAMELMEELK